MKEIDAPRLASELVKASVQGRLKRKRCLAFEQLKMVEDLKALWVYQLAQFKKTGESTGEAAHYFVYAHNFREFEPTKQDVRDGLPEELKELGKMPGFDLLVADVAGCSKKFHIGLDYGKPVSDVVEARISNGEWE